MATVNTLESKSNKNAFYMVFGTAGHCWQVLGTFKLPLKGLSEIIFEDSEFKKVTYSLSYINFSSLSVLG